jgi:hypothetical protein
MEGPLETCTLRSLWSFTALWAMPNAVEEEKRTAISGKSEPDRKLSIDKARNPSDFLPIAKEIATDIVFTLPIKDSCAYKRVAVA